VAPQIFLFKQQKAPSAESNRMRHSDRQIFFTPDDAILLCCGDNDFASSIHPANCCLPIVSFFVHSFIFLRVLFYFYFAFLKPFL
jgi:hypothetical protein